MNAKKGSCLKKIAIGCGGLIALFILVGAVLAISVTLNQPKEPDLGKIEKAEDFTVTQSAQGHGDSQTDQSPLLMVLDVEMAQFRIKPSQTAGTLRLEGDYDKANFELVTHKEETEDGLRYDLKLTYKPGLLATAFSLLKEGGNHDSGNIHGELTLWVGPGRPIDLKVNSRWSDSRFDLSGLPIRSIDTQYSKGSIRISMKEPNPTELTSLRSEGNVGSLRLTDLQNYRAETAHIQNHLGDVNLLAGQAYEKDITFHFKMSMSEVSINLPRGNNLKHDVALSLAEKRGLKEKEPFNPNLPTVTLQGSHSIGEFRVRRYGSRSWLQSKMRNHLAQGDVEAALATYRTTMAELPDPSSSHESMINGLGYYLLRRGKVEDAIAMFKLNVEENPEYANGYDSLGEAYMVNGDTQLAIENYERALEMQPGNGNARRQLKKLRQQLQPAAASQPASAEPQVQQPSQ